MWIELSWSVGGHLLVMMLYSSPRQTRIAFFLDSSLVCQPFSSKWLWLSEFFILDVHVLAPYKNT